MQQWHGEIPAANRLEIPNKKNSLRISQPLLSVKSFRGKFTKVERMYVLMPLSRVCGT